MLKKDGVSTKISTNQGENQILETILQNTEKIKKEVLKKGEETNEEIIIMKDKIEKKKEQNREAQKNYKKIGANFRIDVVDRFEELAHKLNYPNTSAFCKSYLLLLLESEKFQKCFIEFNEMLKEEKKLSPI